LGQDLFQKCCPKVLNEEPKEGNNPCVHKEYMNKMWPILAVEYYSVFKMTELQTHATTWIMLL
jgi:hypothetical protein